MSKYRVGDLVVWKAEDDDMTSVSYVEAVWQPDPDSALRGHTPETSYRVGGYWGWLPESLILEKR